MGCDTQEWTTCDHNNYVLMSENAINMAVSYKELLKLHQFSTSQHIRAASEDRGKVHHGQVASLSEIMHTI